MQNRKPMVLVFAGPNGSGKSTITSFFDKVGRYTNADDIVMSTGMANIDAAILVDKMRYESIEENEDFTFETVLSSEYKMDILRKAKDEGYFIKCVFVLTIDPAINILRIESRVASGGHDVEHIKVIDRYYKSLGHIKELIDAIFYMSMITPRVRRELFVNIKMICPYIQMNIGQSRISLNY